MLLFCFSIHNITFYKLGVFFPCFIKSNTLSPAMLLPGKWIIFWKRYCSFKSLIYPFIFPSLLPAIGKNILKQNRMNLFVLRCFYLSRNVKNHNNRVTEKEDKKCLLFFLLLLFIFFLRAED